MAGSLAVSKPDPPARLSKRQKLAIELFCESKTITAVSKILAKSNGHGERQWRRVLRRWITTNEQFQMELAASGHAELGSAIPQSCGQPRQ
jgi:hypothetical protein